MASASPSPLCTPAACGALPLAHRIAMSSMTRLRMAPGTEAPTPLTQLYYQQRASQGGLLVSECLYTTPDGRGYVRAPGLATDAQAAGWRPVVEGVRARGGAMFLQLFHAGRVSHSSLVGGKPTVSASAVGMAGQLYVEGGVKAAYEVPRALEAGEIAGIVSGFADAAARAVEVAGADGVEIHGGNGYLLQSFMASKTNQRTDAYGGSTANRCRLLLEVVDAVAGRIGRERTGVKVQPGITFSDLVEAEADVTETLDYLGPELSRRQLAYTCLSSLNGEPYFRFVGLPAPNVGFDPWRRFRAGYTGTLMINGGLSVEQGEQYVAEGVADLVAYGAPFIANANLPALVAAGVRTAGLNPGGYNTAVWYSKNPADDAVGYTDWPLVAPEEAAAAKAAA